MPDNSAKVLAKNLRRLLGEQRLSQVEFAKRLGITAQALNRYFSEEGENASLDKIDAFAKALGVSPHELLMWDPQPVSLAKIFFQAAKASQDVANALRRHDLDDPAVKALMTDDENSPIAQELRKLRDEIEEDKKKDLARRKAQGFEDLDDDD